VVFTVVSSGESYLEGEELGDDAKLQLHWGWPLDFRVDSARALGGRFYSGKISLR